MPRPNAPPQKRKRVEPEPEEEPSDSIEEESDDEQPEQGTGFKRVDAFRRQPVPGRGAGDGSDASDDGGSGAEDDDEDDSEGEGKPGDDGSEGESGEGADEDDDDDDGRTLEDQVADVPFEELEALRRDGRGLVGRAARVAAAREAGRSFKRENKDRPQEVSSKRPVGRFREVIQVPHSQHRDPRFASGPGGGPASSDPSFRRRYAFVYDDVLPREREELVAKIKKEKNPKFKARLQAQLQRINTQIRDEDLRRRTQALEADWKTKEKAAVSGGKSPFFLKAADKKRLALLAKYQELKERGKLDKFLEKRRKKNAAKDHRYLPSGRRQQAEDN